MGIDNMGIRSGRMLKEDNSNINVADILADIYDSGSGLIKTSATVEVGAVEIKDSTTDTRAVVGANGLHVDVREMQSTVLGDKTDAPATTGSTDSWSFIAMLKGIYNKLGAVVLTSGTAFIGRTGFTLKKISTNFTRPADTTAYAIGDAITNSTSAPTVFQLDLASIGAVAGQSIEIRKLVVVSSASPSTKILAKAFLSATTFTATNDNSALDIDDTTMEAGGSWFDCDISNSTVSNSRCANIGVHEPIVLAVADTKLYGILQANNAYIPVSGEKFTIIAWVALL